MSHGNHPQNRSEPAEKGNQVLGGQSTNHRGGSSARALKANPGGTSSSPGDSAQGVLIGHSSHILSGYPIRCKETEQEESAPTLPLLTTDFPVHTTTTAELRAVSPAPSTSDLASQSHTYFLRQ